jgi:hypothetical protein
MELKLRNVRLSFPDLFAPRSFKPGDPPKYKSTFLVAKDDPQIKLIEEAILNAAKEKWPKDTVKFINSIRGNANKFCFQDGDLKTYDGYEGMMALSASSKTRPLTIDRDKSPLTEEDGRPYAGCYVNCSIDVFAYDDGQNKGISASLKGVQFVKDGAAFSGSRPASPEDFDDLGVDEEEALC